jgi:CubicO group peptidase (beta-lactamase class C family)
MPNRAVTRTPVLGLLGLLLAAGTRPVRAQTADPRSRDRLIQFANAVSSGDSAALSRFIRRSFAASFLTAVPLRTHLMVLHHMYEASGGWTDLRVLSATRTDASAVARERKTGARARVSIRLEATPPYGISDVNVEAVPDRERPPAGDLGSWLDPVLRRLASHDSFSGAVLVARGDSVVFTGAYGLADRNWQVPNTVDARFNVASMNKMFTAVAIAQLVERGRIRLDDPIARYLGGQLPNHAAERIQIRHLLSHTSGLGDYMGDSAWDLVNRARLRTVTDFLPLVAHDSGSFPPGSRYSYSNSGYLLLGRIIEVASGEPYDRYVAAHVFGPAGMSNSGFVPLDSVTPRLAVGYVRAEGPAQGWRNNLFEHVIRGGPAGGAFSTVGDLYRFARALQGGRLVPPPLVRVLLAPKPELGAPTYGFGFASSDSGRVVGHAGGFPGIVGSLDMFTGSDYIAVVLGNLTIGHSGAGASWAIERVRAWVEGMGPSASVPARPRR